MCASAFLASIENRSHYGVPQRRERVFIVGFRDVHDFEAYRSPTPTMDAATLGQVVFDEAAVGERYYFSERAVAGMRAAKEEMNKGRAQRPSSPGMS